MYYTDSTPHRNGKKRNFEKNLATCRQAGHIVLPQNLII
jgi:hypothetical protein